MAAITTAHSRTTAGDGGCGAGRAADEDQGGRHRGVSRRAAGMTEPGRRAGDPHARGTAGMVTVSDGRLVPPGLVPLVHAAPSIGSG